MRIYKMTATFGKLEHAELELKPGLNVIEAPNEWGKSTWCAFLATMLYGLDTRSKTTKTALADKEKYLPWSGSPMAGRIDLNWEGRDITIERSTRGRIPMGVFRAYETESGLEIPELTPENCGRKLLGAEQSVYRRTGFLRLADLPVTQDDALRRRLNDLVTTGDETGDSDALAEKLKELKNKCRYNRSGLLPQAEAEQAALEEKLQELHSLGQHSARLQERLGETEAWVRSLENHGNALALAAAEADALRVAEAAELRDQAEEKLTQLEQICSRQPSQADVERKIRAIEVYQTEVEAFREEAGEGGAQPEPPEPPEVFRGMDVSQARDMVYRDSETVRQMGDGKPWRLFLVPGWVLLILCLPVLLLKAYFPGGVMAAAGILLLILGARRKEDCRTRLAALEERYGSAYPEAWQMLLQRYEGEQADYDRAILEYRVQQGDLDIRKTFLQKQQESLFGGQSPDQVLEIWQNMQKNWEARNMAAQDFRQASHYWQTLRDMAKPVPDAPVRADPLSYCAADTRKLLEEAWADRLRLRDRLSQYQGQMEALGEAQALEAQLQAVGRRIRRLEEVYEAAALGLETLAQARQELQRKFAPRIAGRAKELLEKMTGGRYDRLTLREDFSLLAGAEQEDTLREVLWRSDGTADQLYVALRLAVAEALIPEAPLVLDDAFVRFDDRRLEETLKILKETAEHRQVILFTCQHREKALLA